MWRQVRWIVAIALCQTLVVYSATAWLPGLSAGRWASLLTALICTLVALICWPAAFRLAARFKLLLFPVLALVVMLMAVYLSEVLTGWVVAEPLEITSPWAAMCLALVLGVVDTLLGVLFSFKDAAAYERFVVRPLQRRYATAERTTTPGIVFIVIDGLAEPLLRQAMAEGYLPAIKRRLDEGRYTLRSWETDLSSQTAACQAGILLGNNTGIPAFRWWDKQQGRLMVAKERATAEHLEATLSSGNGLLARGGGTRFTIFSGDADDCVATLSKLGSSDGVGRLAYLLYFLNVYTVARTFALFLREVVRELWEARYQRVRDVRPRIHRPFSYAFVRAGPTVVLQEAGRFMLIADMLRGAPASYVTFYAYDEVAHHSGIDRPDAFKVLRKLDDILAALEEVAERAPRPYRFVLFSDHGQSMGATFEQRYGQSLGDLVRSLVATDVRVSAPVALDEGIDELHLALDDAIAQGSDSARWMARLLDDQLDANARESGASEVEPDAAAQDVLVLASGNLGLISFPGVEQRLTLEQIDEAYPRLCAGLAAHPGVGFIMLRTAASGPLVLGPHGRHLLATGAVEGSDPLAGYGPNAARHLMRTDGFANAPDILVMSTLNPATGEVAAFEELVGCHGGLGGPQTQPFLLYPHDLPHDPSEPIVGAAALHAVLRGWVDVFQPT